MGKVNDLREMVVSKLNDLKTSFGLKGIYYRIAQDDAVYPHIVFHFENYRPISDDLNRRDFVLEVDVWDKGTSAIRVNNIADAVEDALDQQNFPQKNVLPTIYFDMRKECPDEDKSIQHIQLDFNLQNYERK